MKVSCTTLACPDWSLDTILERFAAYGYDGVDFRGLGGEMELWRLPAFSAEAEATAEKIAGSGLAVSAFSSGARVFFTDPAEGEKQIAEVAEYARLCRQFNAPMIRVFGGSIGQTPLPDAIETAAANLRRMAQAAGGDVTLAMETHDEWTRSRPLAEVMQRVNLPNVGVLWDLHHPYRMGGESPRETFDNIGRYTVATHLKDSRRTGEDEYEYCLPGEGDVPLAEMVGLLAGGGYDGYLTLEWEKKWHPEIADSEVALPAYAEYMRKLASRENE